MLRRLRRLHRLFKANSHCKPWPVTHCTETSQKFVQSLHVFGHLDMFYLAIFASATHRFLMKSSWPPHLRRLYPSHWSCSKDSCYWPRFSMVQVHKQHGKGKSDQYVLQLLQASKTEANYVKCVYLAMAKLHTIATMMLSTQVNLLKCSKVEHMGVECIDVTSSDVHNATFLYRALESHLSLCPSACSSNRCQSWRKCCQRTCCMLPLQAHLALLLQRTSSTNCTISSPEKRPLYSGPQPTGPRTHELSGSRCSTELLH